jgi:hypothetical protein
VSDLLMPDTEHDWRLLRIFLHPNMKGIFEVETDWGAETEEMSLRCSCLAGTRYGHCPHMDYVRSYDPTAEGVTILNLYQGAPLDELHDAVVSGGQTYREFMLKYGEITVL